MESLRFFGVSVEYFGAFPVNFVNLRSFHSVVTMEFSVCTFSTLTAFSRTFSMLTVESFHDYGRHFLPFTLIPFHDDSLPQANHTCTLIPIGRRRDL